MRRSAQTRFDRYGKLYRWTGIALVVVWLSLDSAVSHSFATMFQGALAIGTQLGALIKSTNSLPDRESTKAERK
jgi:hypothetical protein